MNEKHFDYCIVGQGISGTLLSYQLEKAGKKVLIIDNHHQGSATKVAAGIINPITGRNFVLSWRYRDFIDVATETYFDLEKILGCSIFFRPSLIRTLEDIESENQWISKAGDPFFKDLIRYPVDPGAWSKYITHTGALAEISVASRVDMKELIITYKKYKLDRYEYFEHNFDHSQLDFNCPNCILYQGFSFVEMIFCEGAQAGWRNPFFTNHRLSATKGEALIIRCEDLSLGKMFKSKFFIIPLGKDEYWVGAGYQWDSTDDSPTNSGKQEILDHLHAMVDFPPFEIVEHIAAQRPTVHTRRPILMTSIIDSRLHMLNGLGTKGALLAPFITKQFSEYLYTKDDSKLIL